MSQSPSLSAEMRSAAQYLRMSTDLQTYSLEHQLATIAAYADAHDLTVTETYADAGRSGLTVRGRSGLRALLDAIDQGPGFRVLLIFDVSRWGRFQDPDEAAYYEHLCRLAGVEVRYCVEPFDNDGSPMTTLLKSVKRAMAAEYSRELSVKVEKAARRLVAQGLPQGGCAGFGLRRRLLDENGLCLGVLLNGQRKAVRAHRIEYVPGEAREVALVQLIFWFYVEAGLDRAEIARRLNDMDLTPRRVPWNSVILGCLLRNPRYAGDLVYGRKSQRLKGPTRRMAPQTWTRAEGVIEPIIRREVFDKAQRIALARSGAMPKPAMLERMRALLQLRGHLSETIINADSELPSSAHIRRCFGSLAEVYRLLGWTPPHGNRGLFPRTPQGRPDSNGTSHG